MFSRLKKLFYKYFDYDIVGEYYDVEHLGGGKYRYSKKYNRKYYLKCLRKKRGGHR